jgi:hypothetical protein
MRKVLLLSILMFFGKVGNSQTNDTISNPLEKYFQDNYDSTIIYYLNSNTKENKKYYILSRKGDKLYYYLYDSVFISDRKNTDKNLDQYVKRNDKGNNYLHLIPSDTITNKESFWSKIQKINLWNIIDDKNDIEREDYKKKKFTSKGEKEIHTLIYKSRKGEIHSFKLITKNNIIKLEYNELFISDYIIESITRKNIGNLILYINMVFNTHRFEFNTNQ